ncbi:TIGR04084 family radical SAM/SPASM domain-containing protein [Candidatus Thorarchaeota archaeon]|nr:MAG: TIGR04084 family radical SAM/SPASM domain-containing protein [Candidatus Thorarchaeota archaeon]
MNYHIVLTKRCNLNCIYCLEDQDAASAPEVQYSLDGLEEFLDQDEDVQLMFYGGEPTLRIPLMTDIMDRFEDARFMLQTNALLLDRIPEEYVHKLHSVLVSIDGLEETTDFYRSAGVYRKVLKNVRWLREIGYEGDVVARMTVSEQSDIFRDVTHLLELSRPHFDHVHWQLNVIWDAEGNWTDFDGWLERSYKPGLSKLARYWAERMHKGTLLGIVPFLPTMYSILTGEESRMRCGSGIDTFAIHPDGSIGVCPISPDWEFSIVGNIANTKPDDIRNIMEVEEPCPSCDIYGICGGRCLFANKQRLWGDDGFQKVCTTVRHLVDVLAGIQPEVRNLIETGVLSESDFDYPKYNNGCEIIP